MLERCLRTVLLRINLDVCGRSCTIENQITSFLGNALKVDTDVLKIIQRHDDRADLPNKVYKPSLLGIRFAGFKLTSRNTLVLTT